MLKNNICFFQKGRIEIVDGRGNPSFPFHSHQSFLIGVIKRGNAIIKFNDENEYEMHDGMTYVVPSNIGFSLTPITTYSYLTICIKDKLKDELMHYTTTRAILFNIGENICNLCESYKSEMNEDDFLYSLFNVLKLKKMDSRKKPEKYCGNDLVTKAVTYIDEHINEKITLDDIAKNVHISKYHLLREFQKCMSVTPKQYILQSKMRYVRQEVISQKTTIQIATDINFSAQSHLCSLFKKYMAISINDYKKNLTIVKEQ